MTTRTRKPRATKKEPTMTDTDTAPAPAPDTAEATKRRRAIRPDEDAVFFTSEFVTVEPPKRTRIAPPTEYKRAPGYDDAMDALWQKYLNAGSPPWSANVHGVTKDDRPADGWWSERKDIYLSTIVPDAEVARNFVKRAARRIGCGFRFSQEPTMIDVEGVETPAWKIAFTAAPRGKNTDGSSDEDQ